MKPLISMNNAQSESSHFNSHDSIVFDNQNESNLISIEDSHLTQENSSKISNKSDSTLSNSQSNQIQPFNYLSPDIIIQDNNTIDPTNENQDPNIMFQQEPIIIPDSDMLLAKLTFIMFGISGILNWSICLNCMLSVFTIVYNYPRGADTMLIGYFILVITVGFIRLYARAISPWLVFLGTFFLVVANFGLPLIVQLTDGTLGIFLVHIMIAVMGLGVSLIVSNGMAYGAMLPVLFTGYSFAGNGFAGLLGFASWAFLTQIFFDVNIVSDIRYAIWCVFLFAALCLFFTIFLFFKMKKKKWFLKSLAIFQATSKISLDPSRAQKFIKDMKKGYISPSTKLVGVRSIKFILKDTIPFLSMAATSFWLTYSVFPEIGPYDWNGLSLDMISVLVGIYQIFDFVGRYSVNVYKKLRMSTKPLAFFTGIRIVFSPIFILFALYTTPLTTNLTLQIFIMIIFSFTHGILSAQALVKVPQHVITVAERGLMGILINLSTQFGITLSILCANVIKITLDI